MTLSCLASLSASRFPLAFEFPQPRRGPAPRHPCRHSSSAIIRSARTSALSPCSSTVCDSLKSLFHRSNICFRNAALPRHPSRGNGSEPPGTRSSSWLRRQGHRVSDETVGTCREGFEAFSARRPAGNAAANQTSSASFLNEFTSQAPCLR